MSKATPGPWKHTGRKGGWDGVSSVDGTDICHLEFNNPSNATLIAAAPDLLAALRNVEIDLTLAAGIAVGYDLGHALTVVRAAIAKAESSHA